MVTCTGRKVRRSRGDERNEAARCMIGGSGGGGGGGEGEGRENKS